MRSPKPWYRTQTDTWYVCLGGKQIPLAKGKRSKREADEAFHRLMVSRDQHAAEPVRNTSNPTNDGSRILVAVLADQFLDWVQLNLNCYDWCRQFLQQFATACGHLSICELKPFHVSQWLATKSTWGPSTRCRVIGLLKQVFNWGIEQGLINSNPLRSLKKPKAQRRERILTAAELRKIFEAISDGPFRSFLTAMMETGARPGEIRILTAAQIDLQNGICVLLKHKTSEKTNRPRVIYLTPTMTNLCGNLVERWPTGPIFRNQRGRPWTVNAVRIRFRRLRRKFPELNDVVAYTFRHTYATNALVNGVPIATVAELLGHTSTAMIEAHYGHLATERAYLLRAALQATRQRDDSDASGATD